MKKKNTLAPNRKGKVIAAAVVIGLVALALAVWGIKVAYGKLAEVCERQCCVTDSGEQVEVCPDSLLQIIAGHFNFVLCAPLCQNQAQFNTTFCLFAFLLFVPLAIFAFFVFVFAVFVLMIMFLFCHIVFLFNQSFRQIHFRWTLHF